jgi:hypothetical protein
MVVPYKCLPGMDLERDQEIFNTALSRPRIIGEHTIGLLQVLQYIDVCVILHNLLIKVKDPVPCSWYDQDYLMDPMEEYGELNLAAPDIGIKDLRRRQLSNYIVENFRLPK